jgi:RimJ/RimL family protein N-acetyltransferase
MITGKKVLLVRFTKKHLDNPSYFHWLKDDTVTKYIGRPELNKNLTTKTLRRYFSEISKSKNCKFYAIHEKKTKIFIGTAKIKFLRIAERNDKVADVGLMIGEKMYWGKGFGVDTLQTLSQFAFKSLNARKLTGGVMAPNIGMVKAFQKVGFKIEGRLNKQIQFNKSYVDHILFGLMKKNNRNKLK